MPMISPLVFRPPDPVEEKRLELWEWIASRKLSADEGRNECIRSVRVILSGNCSPRQWERSLDIMHPMKRELGRLRLAFNVASRETRACP